MPADRLIHIGGNHITAPLRSGAANPDSEPRSVARRRSYLDVTTSNGSVMATTLNPPVSKWGLKHAG